MTKYNWPLQVPTFTWKDKLKISKWLFTEDRWTQGKYVEDYEKTWSKYVGGAHVIMVSSGSTANELIALRRKWELEGYGGQFESIFNQKKKVLFPACTWISSISPWINIGFEPAFMDIGRNLNSFSEDVEKALKADTNREIGTVFYTTLLGFAGDLEKIANVCRDYKVELLLDNCESSFSWKQFGTNGWDDYYSHFCNYATSSTSIYFSHLTTSGTEGGLIFCKGDEEADWYRMMRSHGMTRGMPEHYKNPNVDPMFDFYYMGSNYRSSNLQAYMASLDFERALKFCKKRKDISLTFSSNLDGGKFDSLVHHPMESEGAYTPMVLPIIVRKNINRPDLINKVKGYLTACGVEYRPIVGGNLLHQTAFKKYGFKPEDFPNAEWIHHNGIYIGLHHKVTYEMVKDLAKEISEL